jgi:hypothetical protein
MDQEYSFMLPDEAAHASADSGSKAIYILDDFGAVDTPFLKPKRVRPKKTVA